MSHLLLQADARRIPLADESVHCVVTSPPYFGLRDYGVEGQIGLEATPDAFVATMVRVFREVWRVMRDDATLWLNLGDSYSGGGGGNYGDGKSVRSSGGQQITNVRNRPGWLNSVGLKPKDLIGIPWRVALALQADGWYLRSDIIWSKPNPMPESVTDRPTKAHEYLFLLAKSERYFYDAEAIQEPMKAESADRYSYAFGGEKAHRLREDAAVGAGTRTHPIGYREVANGRNKRTVWEVNRNGFFGAHFATFPPKLVEPCIKAGCPKGGIVLDPFNGAATTGVVALAHGRRYVGLDLNPEYLAMSRRRIERPHAPVQRKTTTSEGGTHTPLPGQRSLFDEVEVAG